MQSTIKNPTSFPRIYKRPIILFVLLSICTVFYFILRNNKWSDLYIVINDPVQTHSDDKITPSEEMTCHFPQLNPHDPSIQEYAKEPPPKNDCKKDHPRIFTTDLESNLIQIENITSLGYQYCYYQEFTRKDGSDKEINIKEERNNITTQKMAIPTTADFIIVSCVEKPKKGTNKAEHKVVDLFGFVHLKPEIEKRISKTIENGDTSEETTKNPDMNKSKIRQVNIILLGIDSVSHMNFIRTMPRTHEYITKNLSGIGMSGYTKVGDNTFPNIVPLLTGESVDEFKKSSWKNQTDRFDNCTFIWHKYAAKGYRIAYGEDATWMGIFNSGKEGFNKQPTEYYNNALTYQLEEKVGHVKVGRQDLCYGSRLGFEINLDYLKKMAFTMNKTRRYFQFIWATAMTHDRLTAGKLGDQPLLETLKWFKEEGFLEDTVFVLLSDHGIRFGKIRSTFQGRLEERMPFMYFILPNWFRDRYRPAVSNLIRNQHSLTTAFDLHETLLDLLNLENLSSIQHRYIGLNQELPRGISLFLPIPARRNCQDAGIVDQWCVCSRITPVNFQKNSLVTDAAKSIVEFVNKMFSDFPQCAKLTLSEILNAQVYQTDSDKVNDESINITSSADKRLKKQQIKFSVSLRALPSNATFEASTTRLTNGTWEVSGEISRTNLYGDQSICVTDYNLKKFCYCK